MKNIISLIGMSGSGKTTFATSCNPSDYFHYSVDYIIGQHLLCDDILSDVLLKIDSDYLLHEMIKKNKININTNVRVNDLSLVSEFLGKFGGKRFGGLEKNEFLRRQKLYASAEKIATMNLENIADKIFSIGYKYIINDLTGSVCEIVDFDDKDDVVINFLSKTTKKHFTFDHLGVDILIKRAAVAPKPLLYREEFFEKNLADFCDHFNISNYEDVNPDDFCRFIFPKLIENRVEKYQKLI